MAARSSYLYLILLAIIATGLCTSCTAPYDATGTYTGQWSFVDNATQDIINCPLTMTLTQFPSDNATVRGTVHVDYECLTEVSAWPEAIPAPEPADVAVVGGIDPMGKLTLASGGCGPGACVILALSGPGISENEVMVSYSGDWGFAISFAFLGTLGGAGDFQVDRDP